MPDNQPITAESASCRDPLKDGFSRVNEARYRRLNPRNPFNRSAVYAFSTKRIPLHSRKYSFLYPLYRSSRCLVNFIPSRSADYCSSSLFLSSYSSTLTIPSRLFTKLPRLTETYRSLEIYAKAKPRRCRICFYRIVIDLRNICIL